MLINSRLKINEISVLPLSLNKFARDFETNIRDFHLFRNERRRCLEIKSYRKARRRRRATVAFRSAMNGGAPVRPSAPNGVGQVPPAQPARSAVPRRRRLSERRYLSTYLPIQQHALYVALHSLVFSFRYAYVQHRAPKARR